MSNRTKASDRSRALYLRVKALKALTQQLEELEQLLDRVRRAEAKAIRAWRYQGRRQENATAPPGTRAGRCGTETQSGYLTFLRVPEAIIGSRARGNFGGDGRNRTGGSISWKRSNPCP